MDDVESTLRIARRMGYSHLGVPVDVYDDVKEAAGRLGLKLVPRIHIVAESASDVKPIRGRGVVVVEPLSLEAARRAAVARGVHLLRVRPGMQRVIDRSTFRLFKNRGYGAIELSLKHLLDGRTSTWRWFMVSLRRAYAYGLDLVLVSDSHSLWELWHPRSIEGLAELAGIPGKVGLSWVSNVPGSIASLVGVHDGGG